MKRRRRNGVWLPPDPYNAVFTATDVPIQTPLQSVIKVVPIDAPSSAGFSITKSVPLIGDLNEDIIAGVLDPTSIPGNRSSGTLGDISWGYSLARVVGKIFANIEQDNITEDAASDFMLTAGIIVRRVDDSGLPVTADTFTDTYEASRDPWVWRRNWMLQNVGAANIGAFVWPRNNLEVPGVLDGPHVDAKTRRTVKLEERLFLDLTATALNGTDMQVSTRIRVNFDLRFFGRVFQSSGNKRNASR